MTECDNQTGEEEKTQTNTQATIKREDVIMQNSTQTPKYNKSNNEKNGTVVNAMENCPDLSRESSSKKKQTKIKLFDRR